LNKSSKGNLKAVS